MFNSIQAGIFSDAVDDVFDAFFGSYGFIVTVMAVTFIVLFIIMIVGAVKKSSKGKKHSKKPKKEQPDVFENIPERGGSADFFDVPPASRRIDPFGIDGPPVSQQNPPTKGYYPGSDNGYNPNYNNATNVYVAPQATQKTENRCPTCGAARENGEKFCPYCGHKYG